MKKTSVKNIQLVQGLGLFGLIASIFNCTVGGGIFKLPSSVFVLVGTASPVVFAICFVAVALIAAVFILVGKHITTSGGPYAYVRPVLGPYAGFISGVLVWCLGTFAMASVASAYAGFVGAFFPSLLSPQGKAGILFVTFSVFCIFNIVGVKSGSKMSFFFSVAKLIPLLILIGVGLPKLQSEAIALPAVMDWGSIGRASMIMIFAFTGIESALIPSGEIRNPEKILGRALFSGLFLILFLYLGVQLVAQSALGSSMGSGNFASPLAEAAERLMGPFGKILLSVGAILSTAGYLSAMTLSLPRTVYAFAEDGYLPGFLARLHNRYRTPVASILVQILLVWLLAVSSQFEHLAVLANLSAILMYILCVAAALVLQSKSPAKRTSLFARLIPVIALIPMAFLLTSVTWLEWASVGILLVIATVTYWFRR
jgi:basic amino acid/polyamine antiporter, APA family